MDFKTNQLVQNIEECLLTTGLCQHESWEWSGIDLVSTLVRIHVIITKIIWTKGREFIFVELLQCARHYGVLHIYS